MTFLIVFLFLLAFAFFPWTTVLLIAAAVLGVALLSLYAGHRIRRKVKVVDYLLEVAFDFDRQPRVITDRDHPLWSFGARRGPDPIPTNSLRRFQ